MGWRDRAVADSGSGGSWRDRAIADTVDQGSGLVDKAMQFVDEHGASMAGAAMGAARGAAMGAPAGPAGAFIGGVAGAGLGGFGGKGVDILADKLAGRGGPGAGEAAAQMGEAGTEQMLAQAMGPVFSKGAQLVGRGAKAMIGTGAQVMRAAAGVPEKYGAAALANPAALANAPTPEAASSAYKAFEMETGLRGLGAQIVERGESFSPKELERMVIATAKRVFGGEKVPAQDLYSASQAASKLKQFAKYGEPQAKSLVEAGIVDQSKSMVEKALEKEVPGYAGLRQNYFDSKMGEQFDSLLPLNKNQSPNALRAWSSGATAAAGAMAGHPGMLALLPAISPKFYGTAIKAGYRVGQVASAAAPAIKRIAGTSLADHYAQQ